MTFEELQERAKKVFFFFLFVVGTPEECDFYKSYFEKYPNRGNYDIFYNKCLKKHAHTLTTSWDYEEPEHYDTPEELLQAIEDQEQAQAELYL